MRQRLNKIFKLPHYQKGGGNKYIFGSVKGKLQGKQKGLRKRRVIILWSKYDWIFPLHSWQLAFHFKIWWHKEMLLSNWNLREKNPCNYHNCNNWILMITCTSDHQCVLKSCYSVLTPKTTKHRGYGRRVTKYLFLPSSLGKQPNFTQMT